MVKKFGNQTSPYAGTNPFKFIVIKLGDKIRRPCHSWAPMLDQQHWDNAIQCKQRPLQMTVVFGLWIKLCLDYFGSVFPYIYYCLFVCVSLHLSIYHNFLLFYFFFLLRIVWIITYWFSTYSYIVLLLLFILFITCTRLQSLIYNLCDTVLIHWYQYQFGKQSSVSVRLYLYL